MRFNRHVACLLASDCYLVGSSYTLTTGGKNTPFLQLRKSPLCTIYRSGPAGLSAIDQNAIIQRNLPGCDRAQGATKAAMTAEEERELRAQLARLQQEHRDLDAAIAALQETPGSDLIQVQRLKKRKLHLRDRITFIEDQLTPDIIA